MTDASNGDSTAPYTPPPAGQPLTPPPAAAPTPPAYQPPAPAADGTYQPPAPPVPQAAAPLPPAAYPPAPQPAPAASRKKQTSPQTTAIISVVAGALSIVVLPVIAGVVGIGLGATTLRLNGVAKREGRPVVTAHTVMAIAGIVLGAIGIIAKFALDALL